MFFFFKQKTAYEIPKRDWSSDVCSSDLSCQVEFNQQCGQFFSWAAGNFLNWRFRRGLAITENSLEIFGGFAAGFDAVEGRDNFLSEFHFCVHGMEFAVAYCAL